jgi:Fic family protein
MNMKKFDPKKPFNELPKLPPNFNFDDVEILKKVNSANIALSKLSGIAQSIPNRDLLIVPLTVREAVASSGIENINTTVEEVFQASLFDGTCITKEQKEVLHYKDALMEGFALLTERGFLNTNSFIKIQSVLEPDKKGIRKVPGVKIANSVTGEALYTPPETEALIRDSLKNFEDFYNGVEDEGIDILIKTAVCHYQFESIHPFLDGNGRVGRILMVLQLILAQRLQMPIIFLSGYINKNRADYYRLLREVTSSNNWKDWTLFILSAIEEQSKETTSTVVKIKDLMQEYRTEIKSVLPKIYSADLIEFLFSFPYYTQKKLSESMSLNRNTSLKYLNTLQENSFLQLFKLRKENVYYSTKFLNILV